MTLYDIFYQHRWHEHPKDTYHEVMTEMEACAFDYAKDIKDVGDKWKWVIENETRELCRPNHYSFFLSGEKKKWHDTVVSDFLAYIRKALEHYAMDIKELPRNIQALYGTYFGKLKAPKPQQKPSESTGGQMAGNGNETRPEPTAKPVIKESLPTIYADEDTKNLEQRVYYNAILNNWIKVSDDNKAYIWERKNPVKLLAYMCGRLYCGDIVKDDKTAKPDDFGDYPKKLYKGARMEHTKEIKILFSGIDVANNRYQLKDTPPDNYWKIDKLFEVDETSGEKAG